MALRISIDVEGNFITQPAMSVIDGIARERDAAALTFNKAWVAPGARGISLQPVNVTSAWASFGTKLQKADFLLDAAKWDFIEHRDGGDWFAHSRGAAAEPLKTKKALDANCGLWAEFFAYGPPHTKIQDIAIIGLGDRYRLHVHSTGLADLEDMHPIGGGTATYITQGQPLVAGGGELLNKFVQVGLLPWRRGRLLVWTNLGASFEVYVGERLDASDALKARRTPGEPAYHIITEKAQATLDFSVARTASGTPQAPRAFGTLNPLWYPLTGSVVSPAITLPYRTTQAPATSYLESEQQDGATATLSLTDGAGHAFAPDTDHPAATIQYRIGLTAPATSGAYTTLAPVVFGAHIDFDRQLGDRTYDTNEVGSPLSATLILSRDRSQKSFDFLLDNPNERWTSLKDLWNRVITATLDPDPGIPGNVDAVGTLVFKGLTDPADFLDGVGSQIGIHCSGLRKRLRSHLLSDSRSYDGVNDTDTVRQVLHEAGVDDADMVIYDAGGTPLDQADPGDDPLWRPSNGQSADEFIENICTTFSGWVFDDIGGRYFYVPREYFTAAALADLGGVPEVFLQTPLDDLTGSPVDGAQGPNATVMAALKDSVRQTGEEPRANDIWVLGRDSETGEIIAAHYEDPDSIKNRVVNGTNNLSFVGERRTLIYASASITSLGMAQRTLGVLADRYTRPERMVDLRLPDYQWEQLPLEGALNLHGYGAALVTGLTATLDNDRMRPTDYTVELL